MKRWYADNIYCEVSVYLESNKCAIVNNSNEKQVTNFYDGNGKVIKIELEAAQIKWINVE